MTLNKSITLKGYYGLVLVFLLDTYHYNNHRRINQVYDFCKYLKDVYYPYTLMTISIAMIYVYLILVKLRVKITLEASFT